MHTQIIDEDKAEEMYEESLDECHGTMFGFPASYILEKIDPTQYQCGFNDFVDGLADDGTFVNGLTDDEADRD